MSTSSVPSTPTAERRAATKAAAAANDGTATAPATSRKRTLATSVSEAAGSAPAKTKATKASKTDTKPTASAKVSTKAASAGAVSNKKGGASAAAAAPKTSGAGAKTKTAKANKAAPAPASAPSGGDGTSAGNATAGGSSGGGNDTDVEIDADIAYAARGVCVTAAPAAAAAAVSADGAGGDDDKKKKKREPVLFNYIDTDLYNARAKQQYGREAYDTWRKQMGETVVMATFADWRASKTEAARRLAPILRKARMENERVAKRAKVVVPATVEKYLLRLKSSMDATAFGALNGVWLSTYGMEKPDKAAPGKAVKLVYTAAELESGELDTYGDVRVQCALGLFKLAKAFGVSPLGIVSENGKTQEDGTVVYRAEVTGPRVFVGKHLKLQQKAATAFSLAGTDIVYDGKKKKATAAGGAAAGAGGAVAGDDTGDDDEDEEILEEGQLDGGDGADDGDDSTAAAPANTGSA